MSPPSNKGREILRCALDPRLTRFQSWSTIIRCAGLGGAVLKALVLWRRLSQTDFRAINGNASPHGRGGGAMHIALGVRTDDFPIDDFLDAHGQTEGIISATGPLPGQQAQIVFNGNPHRRGGEWRICDQFSHRHPAWQVAQGFPDAYNEDDPPYVLIFKVGRHFHARFSSQDALKKLNALIISTNIGIATSGIAVAPPEYLSSFGIPPATLFDKFEVALDGGKAYAFDPKNLNDGRKRIFASIIRRLGQQSFRKKLIRAYDSRCAFTKCSTIWVLEAAHIVPYKGVQTNSVTNGLLLRADVHTLFDLGLVSIDPDAFVIKVSSRLGGSPYEKLDGKEPAIPLKKALRPSALALRHHYRQFQP